jgi:hypothetical protein
MPDQSSEFFQFWKDFFQTWAGKSWRETMKGNKHMKTITKIIYPALVALALAWVAVSPKAQAVNPPPDGGYAGGNTAEGQSALLSLSTGAYNTAVGFSSLLSNADTSFNTGVGAGTLLLNTADENTATGAGALLSNTTGSQNTANGAFALFSNTTESFNTATGFQALFSNTGDGGHYNVATGYQALFSNTTGRRNVADGPTALFSNTAGNFNTALGDQALYSNSTGIVNTAIGWGALYSNTNCYDPGCTGGGGANTAVGAEALISNTAGGGNTAVGEGALINHLTGNQNIVLGLRAGQDLTDGQVNIYIANQGVPSENTTIRIGNVVAWTDIYGFGHPAHTATYIAGINGATASGGVAVYINSDGQLGTLTSSARFKTEIKPMDESSEAVLALKPVTFRYKQEIDPKGIPQFGLVAEEVEKVNPDLVSRDRDGKPYTVRYEAVNAMLLNEFLKAHRRIEEQDMRIDQLTAQLKEQAALIQKVNDKVELNRSAPQTVLNNRGRGD